MKALIYDIELLEHTLVTRIEGDPNSAVAHDHLPGSALRGLFVGLYLRANEGRVTPETLLSQTDAEKSAEIEALFFDGNARYLNGYPLLNGTRSLPVPMSWHEDKNAGDGDNRTFVDFSFGAPDQHEGESWKSVKHPYWTASKGYAEVFRPLRNIAIHTQRDRIAGRSRRGSGAVFRNDALAAGQTFRAAIVGKDEVVDRLAALLQVGVEGLALGRSRNGGYGRVTLTVRDAPQNPWREIGSSLAAPKDEFTITLLSDCVIRNELGQTCVDPAVLARLIARILEGTSISLDPVRSFSAHELVGGFNRKWESPLNQDIALRRGSVLVFKLNGPAGADLTRKLLALEDEGIGERRVDGYGRIAVNWLRKEPWVGRIPSDAPYADDDKAEALGGDAGKIAKAMAERGMLRKLDQRVLEIAVGSRVANPPSRAQIARLRAEIAATTRMPAVDGIKVIHNLLDSMLKRKVTREQWSRARLEIRSQPRGPLEPFVRNALDVAGGIGGEDSFWKLMGMNDEQKSYALRRVAGHQPALTPAVVNRFSLLLIDSILKGSSKGQGE